MTQDKIIRMALEACAPNQTFNSDEEWVKCFAALVAETTGIEQQREIIRLKAIIEEQANGAQNLVLAEREACAKVCDKEMDDWDYESVVNVALNNCAASIRARSTLIGEKNV